MRMPLFSVRLVPKPPSLFGHPSQSIATRQTALQKSDLEARFEIKAGEGTRTLDIQLGKLALCQLSYARDALYFIPRTPSRKRALYT